MILAAGRQACAACRYPLNPEVPLKSLPILAFSGNSQGFSRDFPGWRWLYPLATISIRFTIIPSEVNRKQVETRKLGNLERFCGNKENGKRTA
jgi:hypothetical protein